LDSRMVIRENERELYVGSRRLRKSPEVSRIQFFASEKETAG